MRRLGIELVLFDLGGVLVELRGVGALRELAKLGSDEEFWQRWLACRWVRALESGRCSPEQFACGLVEDWGLQAEPDELLERFRAWPVGPLPGAEELVARLRRSVRVGCLSNTNALHWAEHFSSWRLMELLDPRFLSFQIGVLKPDREVFDHVAAAVGIPRERVLLLDDNVANVEGARAAGFAAIQVTGVDGARATIDSLGLLRSGASD